MRPGRDYLNFQILHFQGLFSLKSVDRFRVNNFVPIDFNAPMDLDDIGILIACDFDLDGFFCKDLRLHIGLHGKSDWLVEPVDVSTVYLKCLAESIASLDFQDIRAKAYRQAIAHLKFASPHLPSQEIEQLAKESVVTLTEAIENRSLNLGRGEKLQDDHLPMIHLLALSANLPYISVKQLVDVSKINMNKVTSLMCTFTSGDPEMSRTDRTNQATAPNTCGAFSCSMQLTSISPLNRIKAKLSEIKRMIGELQTNVDTTNSRIKTVEEQLNRDYEQVEDQVKQLQASQESIKVLAKSVDRLRP